MKTMLMTTMKFCELDDDEIFNVTSTFTDINALTAVITLSYKLSFKFIKSSFKSNSEISHALSFEIASEALFKSAALSH